MAGKIFINYGTRRRRTLAAIVAAVVLLLIGAGGYVLLQYSVDRGVHLAELKWEEEHRAAMAEANRKLKQAEQRIAALEAQQRGLFQTEFKREEERRLAEANRKVKQAEQRIAALEAEQKRQARMAAEAAKSKAEDAEQQRLAVVNAEHERQARMAVEAEAKRKADNAERQRIAAIKAEEERRAKAASEEAERQRQAQVPLPKFPWPPPTASAFYVLPDNWFDSLHTLGEVVGAIVSALEPNGYVERSFFGIEGGGVALVTQLERIRDDGSSFVEPQRWPKASQNNSLSAFLRGLFFVEPGHFRVIVFVLRELPFSQSSQIATRDEARDWLRSGANTLPPEAAKAPFGGGHCTVLIYEFASDGAAVRVVQSSLTGKQHLTKAGLLSLLEKH